MTLLTLPVTGQCFRRPPLRAFEGINTSLKRMKKVVSLSEDPQVSIRLKIL